MSSKSTILKIVCILILVCGLCGYLFELREYDFFAQLNKISSLDFNNPIDELIELIDNVKDISTWGSLNIEWYEYIPKFFNWLGKILATPIYIVKDVFVNIYYGLKSVLYIIGF